MSKNIRYLGICIIVLMQVIAIQYLFSLELSEPSEIQYPWGNQRQKQLVEMSQTYSEKHLSNYQILETPITDVSNIVKHYPKDKILIFGYGSLMSKKSASRTITDKALETYKPAVAFGVKRIFNLNGFFLFC